MAPDESIPDALYDALLALGMRLQEGGDPAHLLPSVLRQLNALAPGSINRHSQITHAAKLYHERPARTRALTWFGGRRSNKEQLLHLPDLAYLFLFHADGYLREAALKRIYGPLPSPFIFAALCLRLNDWAEPVRNAAQACAQRCFPSTPTNVIVEAMMSLVLRQRSWRRWHGEKEVVDAALARPDVAEAMARHIGQQAAGRVAPAFRLILRQAAIDPYLPWLALHAQQPPVRSIAVQVIADEEASWPVGVEWHWLDKVYGRRRRVLVMEHRKVQAFPEKEAILRHAAQDRSPVVRRTVLTALIQHRTSDALARAIAQPLKADRNLSVRERAAFIFARKDAGPAAPP